MTFCWFATFRGAAEAGAAEIDALAGFLARTPGLAQALIHTPATTSDPYLNDGPSPALALQLYFPEIAALEAALAAGGHLQALAGAACPPSLAGAEVTQQAMLARAFPVPDPAFRTPAGALPCTYLVAYEGAAEDLNVWLAHYIDHHPPIMARFPGIRQIEIYTRIDWCGFVPFARVEHMQRNKVVFDSPEALTAALNSPVRHEMRADFKRFPAFSGGNTHFPMLTRAVG
ncbi:EthD domain-containing protein [Limobrevibacterium gyesilva]|uniref:Ethyl tert-butyl ether degradation EthD n=1 Tax=Limobrevibacterium gyesilva TaxID=2991712 RepID=A0AA41YQD7_9PROT|nr:hypothetical protein [Limobrevibacterium gyesilva]MCW3476662.1 hypothetical protein [Limobrevibacterium gyesilva]